MKNIFLGLLCFMPALVFSQNKPVKIVFDVTSKDTSTHQAVLRHVGGMAKAYPDARLEVVIYGGAWPMVVDEMSSSASSVEELARNKNVSFKICGLTMERYNVEKSQLITGVKVVLDAIIEIVNRQNEGWEYIIESHN